MNVWYNWQNGISVYFFVKKQEFHSNLLKRRLCMGEMCMRKWVLRVLCLLVAAVLAAGPAAADIVGIMNGTEQHEYKPLDIVVAFDISGSMKYSDSDKITPHAVNILTNMMFEKESRIGVVVFNTTPRFLTESSDYSPEMIPLSDTDRVGEMLEDLQKVRYEDGTGIGNALLAATEMMEANKLDEDRQKVILLFTDGVDDFGSSIRAPLRMAECKENEASAITWAMENDCPIYCVGYDFVSGGVHSMGVGGEGLEKLKNISRSTGGVASKADNVHEIESLFIRMLGEICGITIIDIESSDNVYIYITPEVVEANIRIRSTVDSALLNGTVELYNPDGERVVLENSETLKYNVDRLGATLKLIEPARGTWVLKLLGIDKEAVDISYLSHYDLSLESELTMPAGNPEGVAYRGDTVEISSWLVSNGIRIEDSAIYEEITDASLVVTSRMDPMNPVEYALTRQGNRYTGKFVIEDDCIYDVKVTLISPGFIRSQLLEIQSGNKPLQLIGSLDDVEVNNRSEIQVENIFDCVEDEEGDSITAEVTDISDLEMVDARVVGDKILIEGKSWGAALITITFTDAQGNQVKSTFQAKVNDPLALAMIILSVVLLILLILAALYISYRKSFIIKGRISVLKIEDHVKVGTGNDFVLKQVVFAAPENMDTVDVTKTMSEPNPFGGSASAASTNPFGGSTSAAGTSPFGGSASAAGTNPFGGSASAAGTNPFGGSTSAAGTNPFGGSIPASETSSFESMSAGEGEDSASEAEEKQHKNFEKFEGGNLISIRTALGRVKAEQHFFKVLQKFVQRYKEHMNRNAAIKTSFRAAQTENIINRFEELNRVKVKGTPFGMKGFDLIFPAKCEVVPEKLSKEKNVVHVCQVNGNKRVFGFSVEYQDERDDRTHKAYIEMEYRK